jgi:hypothetical protein
MAFRLRLNHDDGLNYVYSLYNFGANRIDFTTSTSSSTVLCLSLAAETCVNSVEKLWFIQAYLLPRKPA